MKKIIWFLIRRKLGVKKYQQFIFTNQLSENTSYMIGSDKIFKVQGNRLKHSDVSINWILSDECEIKVVQQNGVLFIRGSSKEEKLLGILRGNDKEHFAIVNGFGNIEIYSRKEFLETPIPISKDDEKKKKPKVTVKKITSRIVDCWGGAEYDDIYMVLKSDGEPIYISETDPTSLIELLTSCK